MADKPFPTKDKIEKAVRAQAKKWSDRSGMSSTSWEIEIITALGFSKSGVNTYKAVRDMVKNVLVNTSYLKETTVCGSTAFSVRAGTF